jgi:hypothetical protein
MARAKRSVTPKKGQKRSAVKAVRRAKERRNARFEAIQQALHRSKKAELIELLVSLMNDREETKVWLEDRLEIPKEAPEEAEDLARDIELATNVPNDKIGHNFSFDYDAYERIEKGFRRLLRTGHMAVAMELSETLIDAGSRQITMSDEGMMTDDIVACLRPVVAAVRKSSLAPSDKEEWFARMEKLDHSGYAWNMVLSRR